jgi:hypothetical protein
MIPVALTDALEHSTTEDLLPVLGAGFEADVDVATVVVEDLPLYLDT